jgi:hypothetical protein
VDVVWSGWTGLVSQDTLQDVLSRGSTLKVVVAKVGDLCYHDTQTWRTIVSIRQLLELGLHQVDHLSYAPVGGWERSHVRIDLL